MNSDWSDHRHHTTIQNTCSKILNTPSVEKTVNLHRFQEIYKAGNINVLLSQCRPQRNGSASHHKSLWWVTKSAIYPMPDDMLWCGSEEDGNNRRVRKVKVLWRWRWWHWLVKVDRSWHTFCIKHIKFMVKYFTFTDVFYVGGSS